MFHLLKKQSGFTITEVLVTTGLLVIAVSALMSLGQLVRNSKLQVDSTLAVVNFKATLISALRSSDAFAKSATGNSCLMNRTGCGAASTVYATFSVLDNAGNPLTNKAPNYGFTRDLKVCTTYPSTACPFRYTTEWRMVCRNASCAVPQLKVRGTLTVDPADKISMKTDKYGFEISLGQFIGTFEQSCSTLGGTYVPGEPPRCDMPIVGNCPAGSRVTGIVPGSPPSKICKPLVWSIAPCASGTQVMVGVNPDGTANCKNLKGPNCASPTDPACNPWICEKDPMNPSCPQAPGPAAGWGDGGGDGGCGDGGC